jgi:hypothetical protein
VVGAVDRRQRSNRQQAHQEPPLVHFAAIRTPS